MIVIDTSLLVAYWSRHDAHHEKARKAMPSIVDGSYGPALIPEYVYVEFLTVLASRAGMDATRKAITTLTLGQQFTIVRSTRLLPNAQGVFRKQDTFQFSLVDVMVLLLAWSYQPAYVATFDDGIRKHRRIVPVPAE